MDDIRLLVPENIRVTTIFYKALLQSRVKTQMLLVFCIVKITISLGLIFTKIEKCSFGNYDLWLAAIFIQSIIALSCYRQSLKFMKNLDIIFQVAENLHQAIYYDNDQAPNFALNESLIIAPPGNYSSYFHNRKKLLIHLLIMPTMFKIKKCRFCRAKLDMKQISNKSTFLKIMGYVSFVFNQILIGWGFVYYIKDSVNECNQAVMIFISIFLVFSIIQYIEIYLFLIIIVICLPFALIYVCYTLLKKKQLRSKNKQQIEKLLHNYVLYKPGLIEGDPECKICMQPYNLGDKVIILPCNPLHHYDKNCIQTWLTLNPSCPFCRKNFTLDEEEDGNLIMMQAIEH